MNAKSRTRAVKWRVIAIPFRFTPVFSGDENGGTRRALVHEYPPWPAVWQQYRRWRHNVVHEAPVGVRAKAGRHVRPSATISDSRSIQVAE